MKLKSMLSNIFIKKHDGHTRIYGPKTKFIMDGKEIPIKRFALDYGISEFMDLFPTEISITLTVETDERS
jgi:hypothetical protein